MEPPPEGEVAARDSCGGRDICVDGRCDEAFGRRYLVAVAGVVFTERDGAGDCWDAACGAPDPFANVYVDGVFVGGTSTRMDTYEARWDPEGDGIVGDAAVVVGSTARVDVFDADLSADDLVLRCDFDLSAQRLRERVILCVNRDETVAVVLLLRLNFLGTRGRAAFMRRHPPAVYVLPDRPSFTGKGTDSIEYAWFVWPRERREAGTIRVLATTDKDQRQQRKPVRGPDQPAPKDALRR